jgi:hypothetical protein
LETFHHIRKIIEVDEMEGNGMRRLPEREECRERRFFATSEWNFEGFCSRRRNV